MSVSPATFVIDSKVNDYSVNPVQNKAIYDCLQNDFSYTKILDMPMASLFDGTLESVDNSQITSLKDYALTQQSNLQSVVLPNCTSIGLSACSFCERLSEVTAPKVSQLYEGAFMYCRMLETVDFRDATNGAFIADQDGVYDSPFKFCFALTDVWLGGDVWTIPSGLDASDVFDFIATDFKLHVPSDVLSDYQNDAQWSYLSDYMVGFSS